MLYYAKTEALRMLRNRRYLIFVVAFPVVLYLINAGIYGKQTDDSGVPYSVALMVSMAAYGALAASMMSSAVPWAQERQTGWLRQLQITPLPGWAIIVTKLCAAMLLVLPSLLLVSVVGVVVEGVSLPVGTWVPLLLALWLGTLPFVALGLAIGSTLSADAAQPAAMISMFALALAGGLWFPPEAFGDTMRTIAELTPSYRYADLGWSVIAGQGLPASDLLVVGAWGLALGAAAVFLYRRATVRS
ncbi:ABC transporter permease [Nonomuraea pusilla]|uniref:ABC-2 type transport system permease protein n=1 Tax=Nonomuraea pusilla TaxID=46177 RepID=A0A1H7UNR4_9ACTN|nr:ABC transporter permease [Nonomuraea pusilla]SEL98611.1 ABC-2 type transport system permease protein [Nonomuraea pusilla]